jgi:hypothetical protein
MGWTYGSSSRMPTLQAQSPEFKPQSHKKKKKEEKKIETFKSLQTYIMWQFS